MLLCTVLLNIVTLSSLDIMLTGHSW